MNMTLLRRLVAGLSLGILCALAVHAQGLNAPPQPRDQGHGDPRSSAKIHTELAAVYFQAGNFSVALDELKLALEFDSRYYQANSVRGLVYAQLKEFAKAEEDFRRALNLAPNDPEVNNNYGWYLCETGKPRESIAYFLNALKDPLYSTPDRAYTNAGICAMRAGDLEGAQKYLLQAVSLSRDGSPQARLQLAKLFYQRGIFEESRIYLNDALKMMDPPTADAVWLALRMERRLGNKAAESNYAAQLRSRYPTSPEYQSFLKGEFE